MTSCCRVACRHYGCSLFSMRKSPQVSDHVLPGFDKVPSTPQISIEISLTNKNRLVVLFTQWGCYFAVVVIFVCILGLSIFKPLIWLNLSFFIGVYTIKVFRNIYEMQNVNMYMFWWRRLLYGLPPLTKSIYLLYVSVHALLDGSEPRQKAPGCIEIKARWALSEKMAMGHKHQDGPINVSLRR